MQELEMAYLNYLLKFNSDLHSALKLNIGTTLIRETAKFFEIWMTLEKIEIKWIDEVIQTKYNAPTPLIFF